ncbi:MULTISPECIES: RNA chaperone Hfq [Bacillaceae]|uniref:RNA-binding protein Hfq n=2 Tax=Domibacillus aminovorans TaxID=29332 RepID=A0A177KKB9_9BACI|nr:MULTISPECIES: RNA chaperone Hfq [Bacillaceae]OAH53840.1 RNA chaperone Hfq [Domibacillus aminovorans]
MKQPINIQDQFLNQLRKDSTMVTVFLLNGFQLRGLIKGFDNFTVLVETDGKQQLVYKHAISTFAPQRSVSLNFDEVSLQLDKQ